jgi:hypothetical protein
MTLCLLQLLFLKECDSILKTGGFGLIFVTLCRRFSGKRGRRPALRDGRLASNLFLDLGVFLPLVYFGSRFPGRWDVGILAGRGRHKWFLNKGRRRAARLERCNWGRGGLIEGGNAILE